MDNCCSDAASRRGLAEAVQELKTEVATSRWPAVGDRSPLHQRDGDALGAMGRDKPVYDDGGFFHYMNSGREQMPSPPGGWLGSPDPTASARTPSSAAVTPDVRYPSNSPNQALALARGSSPVPNWSTAASNGLGNGSSPSNPSSNFASDAPLAVKDYMDPAKQQDAAAGGRPGADNPTYPHSFHEVMEMVSKGVTPSNVRSDINDKPPDPTRPPSEPKSKPLPKPWERQTSPASGFGTDTFTASSTEAYSPSMNSNRMPNGAGPDPLSPPLFAGLQSPMSARPTYPSPYGGSSSSIYATSTNADALGASSAAPPSVVSPSTSVLSVLQPLVAGGSSWNPPSPPAPTIPQTSITQEMSNGSRSSISEGVQYPASGSEARESPISQIEVES